MRFLFAVLAIAAVSFGAVDAQLVKKCGESLPAGSIVALKCEAPCVPVLQADKSSKCVPKAASAFAPEETAAERVADWFQATEGRLAELGRTIEADIQKAENSKPVKLLQEALIELAHQALIKLDLPKFGEQARQFEQVLKQLEEKVSSEVKTYLINAEPKAEAAIKSLFEDGRQFISHESGALQVQLSTWEAKLIQLLHLGTVHQL